jgi:hypothetical protein
LSTAVSKTPGLNSDTNVAYSSITATGKGAIVEASAETSNTTATSYANSPNLDDGVYVYQYSKNGDVV